MKTKLIFQISILMLLFCLVIVRCKKKENEIPTSYTSTTPTSNPTDVDLITDEQITELESLVTDTISQFSDIVFDDGSNIESFLLQYDPEFLNEDPGRKIQNSRISLTTEEKRRLLIARMSKVGCHLINRNNFKMLDSGLGKPAQYGLAYVFGAKQYVNRESAKICTEKLYGLDCSGMVYQMLSQSNLKIIANSSYCNVKHLSNIASWNLAFLNSSEFSGLTAVDLGHIAIEEIKPGDIVYWMGNHIGVALYAGNQLKLLNSIGRDTITYCKKKNKDKDHGPVKKDLTPTFLNDPKFGAQYKVIRISSGEIWKGNYTLTTNLPCNNITTLNSSGVVTMYFSLIGNNFSEGFINVNNLKTWEDPSLNYNCTVIPSKTNFGPLEYLYGPDPFSCNLVLTNNPGILNLKFNGTLTGNIISGTVSSSNNSVGTFSVTKQ